MPVLLLAQGDPQVKTMLRKAIDARYGLRPVPLESLKLDFKGRARAKIGPVSTWVPVEGSAQFQFPRFLRWDFVAKAVGVQVGSSTEAFDGVIYRSRRGKSVDVNEDTEAISSMQKRLWAIAAVLLTPLGEQFVKLEAKGENQFQATNTQINVGVDLHLHNNNSLDSVETICRNPDTERQQRFILRLSQDIASVNDLILPCKISAFWDDEPYFEVEPVKAEVNPTIAPQVFALEDR